MARDVADFRSDTVTRPTDEMRRRMADARVGDDVMGEDPTVNSLESAAAELLGKEAALFVVSGTMGNQLAVAAQTERGDEVILERTSHIFRWEVGAVGAVSGCQTATVEGERGVMTAGQVDAAMRKMEDIHMPRTALVCLECTHNYGGGRVYPLDEIERISEAVRGAGARLHLDGARMFNAVAAGAYSAAELAGAFDTVQFCLSKGLGAPVGSVLAGDADTIEKARRLRKMLGGGWRQAGILAAGGLHALENHVDRLAEDNARAKRLAEALAGLDGVTARPEEVETNIMFFTVGSPERDVLLGEHLAERGVLIEEAGHFPWNRCVTHLDVDDADVERCVEEVKGFVESR